MLNIKDLFIFAKTKDFGACQRVLRGIILTYEDDFSKYRKRISPELLQIAMHGVCHQIGQKFSFSQASSDYRSAQIRSALRLLTLAGIVIPVTATSGNGLPLDAEANESIVKYLFLDPGLLLAILQLDGNAPQKMIEFILSGTPQDLVNKGGITEMVAGLEIMRYKEPIMRYKMFYWKQTGNSIAEVDYLEAQNAQVIPIEVKARTQGGMKSLWQFMRAKKINYAIRTSLENFGSFSYTDPLDNGAVREVDIVPLYALSNHP